YKLKGIIYFANEHFTCRIIQSDGTVWFHDGITTGRFLTRDGNIGDSINLSSSRTQDAVAAFYAQV
ncbi:hypothetical protein BDZ94DRAFT_1351343, partial [Collybia nuda]